MLGGLAPVQVVVDAALELVAGTAVLDVADTVVPTAAGFDAWVELQPYRPGRPHRAA